MKVRYSFVASPFGDLLAARTPRGIVRLAFPEEDTDAALDELAANVSPEIEEAAPGLEAGELEEYFEGRRRSFGLRADLSLVPEGFSRRVLEATGRIPFGAVSTYGDVARRAGSRRAARAAGNALGGNPVPIVIPCHRVVPAGGGLGGYGGHEDRKAFLLRLEGAVRP